MRFSDLTDDWNRRGGPAYPHERVVQFCFRHYPREIRSRTRVLDLGCGSGVHVVFLAREGFTVEGVDISPVGIENTRRKLREAGLDARLRTTSIATVDLADESCQLVICTGVFEVAGFNTARASVAETARVLSPGGRGLFLFASDVDFRNADPTLLGFHGYSEEEAYALFDGGFSNVCFDRTITTYENGGVEQNEWLITLTR